jgi:ABC-2 type transport system ATP-binding protein
MKYAITAKDLRKTFNVAKKNVVAVNDISFDIAEGELVGFIGKNGAGKTTTLKCLSGLLVPDKGDVEVLGYTPSERSHDFLQKISMLMVSYGGNCLQMKLFCLTKRYIK